MKSLRMSSAGYGPSRRGERDRERSGSAADSAARADRRVGRGPAGHDVEKQILDVADAMPEEKYGFSPETLKLPGAEYKGVRTLRRAAQAHRRFQLLPLGAVDRREAAGRLQGRQRPGGTSRARPRSSSS